MSDRFLGYGDGKASYLHPGLVKELVDAKVSGMGMAVLCAYLAFTDKGSPLGMHVYMGHEYAMRRADIADELGVGEQPVGKCHQVARQEGGAEAA